MSVLPGIVTCFVLGLALLWELPTGDGLRQELEWHSLPKPSVKSESLRKAVSSVKDWIGPITSFSYVLTFACIAFLVPSLVFSVSIPSLEWIVLGFGVVTFVGLQTPRLAPPSIQVCFVQASGTKYEDNHLMRLRLARGELQLVWLRIANTGLLRLDHVSCWMTFKDTNDIGLVGRDGRIHWKDHCETLPIEDPYRSTEFVRELTIQKRNACFYLDGDRQALGLDRSSAMLIPVYVHVGPDFDSGILEVEVTSSTSFGSAKRRLALRNEPSPKQNQSRT